MVLARLEESARFQLLSVHPVGRRDHHDMVVLQHLQSGSVDGVLRLRRLCHVRYHGSAIRKEEVDVRQ